MESLDDFMKLEINRCPTDQEKKQFQEASSNMKRQVL